MGTRSYRPANKYEPMQAHVESAAKSAWAWLNLKSVLTFGAIVSLVIGTLFYIEIKQQTCVFEYTNIPEEFKKKGFTEQFVFNTINKIQHHIIMYEPSIRDEVKKTKDYTINQTLSSGDMKSIEGMNIQGIPLLSLIHLADRVLNLVGFPSDENYASLEFTTVGEQLHLAVLFKGIRREFNANCKETSLMNSFYQLCYDASIFILEETKPITLVDYYHNMGKPQQCISECLKVITSEHKNNKVRSRAYTFLGISLLGYTNRVADKFKIATELDPFNHEAHLWSMALDTGAFKWYTDSVRSLIRVDSSVYTYWEQLLSLQMSGNGDRDSSYLQLSYLHPAMERNLRDASYPSQLYWDCGRAFQDWGKTDKKWYDRALEKYNKAVECESRCASPDVKKLSQYYNSIAYTLEIIALKNAGLNPDSCFDKTNIDPMLPLALEVTHAYARQAVAADTLNPYAWSTLGEYYGLCYMASKDESMLVKCTDALVHARRYGIAIDDFSNTEPYCYLKKKHFDLYRRILSTDEYYKGPLANLRQLRVL